MSERELKNGAAFDKVVAKAWTDPAFKAQLLADPRATLAAAGLAIPPDVTVKVVENTDKLVHLALNAYRPTPYIGRLVFFKAAERPPGDVWDYSRGWRELVTGEFAVYEVPGDHRSMFLEPNVETLANNMRNYLARKQGAGS